MPSLEFCDIAYRTTILPTGVSNTSQMFSKFWHVCLTIVIRFRSLTPLSDLCLVAPRLVPMLPYTTLRSYEPQQSVCEDRSKDCSKLKFADVPLEKHLEKSHERIYFPFNMDKQHWVGVCINTKACTLHVLDCNTSFRSDSSLKKELNPIATLLPYVLKQFGFLGTNAGVKAFTVSRCKGIPHVSSQIDSGVMMILLIEADAGDGLGACKAITPRLLPDASKKLVVKLFDDISM